MRLKITNLSTTAITVTFKYLVFTVTFLTVRKVKTPKDKKQIDENSVKAKRVFSSQTFRYKRTNIDYSLRYKNINYKNFQKTWSLTIEYIDILCIWTDKTSTNAAK